MLFVVCSVIHLILPASCDRPALSFDQSLAVGSHSAALDLKKHARAARHQANETISSLAGLREPKGGQVQVQFAAGDGNLGFEVAQKAEGKYFVESVGDGSKAADAMLKPNMQIIQINQRPVDEMTEDEVRRACAHESPEVLDLVLAKSGTAEQVDLGDDFPDTRADGANEPQFGLSDVAELEEQEALFSECQWSSGAFQKAHMFNCLRSLSGENEPTLGKRLTKKQYECMKRTLGHIMAAEGIDDWIRAFFKQTREQGTSGEIVSKHKSSAETGGKLKVSEVDEGSSRENLSSTDEFASHRETPHQDELESNHTTHLKESNETMDEELKELEWTGPLIEKFTTKFSCLQQEHIEEGDHLSPKQYECIKKMCSFMMPPAEIKDWTIAVFEGTKAEGTSGEIGSTHKGGPRTGSSTNEVVIHEDTSHQDDFDITNETMHESLKELEWTGPLIEKFQSKFPCMQGEHIEPDDHLSPKQYECIKKMCSFMMPPDEIKDWTIAVFEGTKEGIGDFDVDTQSSPGKAPPTGSTGHDVEIFSDSDNTGHEDHEEGTNPKAASHFATKGVLANKQLRNEFCRAVHHHKHLKLTTSDIIGPPIYTESTASTKREKSDPIWELFVLCPYPKKPSQVAQLPEHIREQYAMKPTSVIVQAVSDAGHRATWLPDRAKMLFNTEQHTLTLDMGAPLAPEAAYPKIGENITDWHRSLELPEVLERADCRLIVQLYYVPMWDADAVAKGELVIGKTRADIIPTLQCCTSSPCTESERTWWKSFV